jgi:hypothetical protein
MEPWRDWSELDNTVEDMVFIVIQYNDMIGEEIVDVFFCVQLLPIFKAEPRKLLKHLTFLQKVHFLGFLLITFWVEFHQLQQEVLHDLHQRKSHVDLASEARMHG